MQGLTEEAEASAFTDDVREGPTTNLDTSSTFAVRRTAAKRTLPWDLAAGELILASPQPPPPPTQAGDIPATKKPRLEEPISASTDEAATKISSLDTAVSLPAAATAASDDADEYPVKGTRAMAHWTPGEDAKLTSAVTNTSKKRWGREYIRDWVAIAALVPGRAGSGSKEKQCSSRWHDYLDPTIDRTIGRTGKWAEDEDIKLKDAVQTHGDKNWGAIAALVPGRTLKQCNKRWRDVLDRNRSTVLGKARRTLKKAPALTLEEVMA
jgi:hypothetical protein